jgi:hypothetical protein
VIIVLNNFGLQLGLGLTNADRTVRRPFVESADYPVASPAVAIEEKMRQSALWAFFPVAIVTSAQSLTKNDSALAFVDILPP